MIALVLGSHSMQIKRMSPRREQFLAFVFCAAAVVGCVVCIAGAGYGTFRWHHSRTPRAVSMADFMRDPGQNDNLILTGCTIGYFAAVTVTRQNSSEELAHYAPVWADGAFAAAIPAAPVLLVVDDESILASVRAMRKLTVEERDRFVLEHPNVLVTGATIKGQRRVGLFGNDVDPALFVNNSWKPRPNFAVIQPGGAPSLKRPAILLAVGMALGFYAIYAVKAIRRLGALERDPLLSRNTKQIL
jgi:hypothetical protein